MHDPDTLILRLGPLTLWHHDPCTDGTDDSCNRNRTRINPRLRSNLEFLATKDCCVAMEDLFYIRAKQPGPVTGHALAMIFLEIVHERMGRPVKNWPRAKSRIASNLWKSMAFRPGYHSNHKGDHPDDRGFQQYRTDIVLGAARLIMEHANPYRWHHGLAWHVHHWRFHLRPFWRRQDQCCVDQEAKPGPNSQTH